jgi:hypothetical protein
VYSLLFFFFNQGIDALLILPGIASKTFTVKSTLSASIPRKYWSLRKEKMNTGWEDAYKYILFVYFTSVNTSRRFHDTFHATVYRLSWQTPKKLSRSADPSSTNILWALPIRRRLSQIPNKRSANGSVCFGACKSLWRQCSWRRTLFVQVTCKPCFMLIIILVVALTLHFILWT